MRSATNFLGLGLALALGPSPGPAEAAPRAGKVVRVERRSHGLTGNPRYCAVHAGDLYGSCVGEKEPEVGERLTAIDQNHVLGTMRIASVTPYNDGCQDTNTWMITAVVDSGDSSNFSLARGQIIGLADVPLDTRSAHLVNVDRTPTGHQWGTDIIYAIDDHDDGSVDLEFIQFTCDDAGNLSLNAPTGTCFEVWAPQTGKSLERLRSERVKNCY